MVQLRDRDACGFRVRLRLPDDDSESVHQLPPKERGAHASEGDDI